MTEALNQASVDTAAPLPGGIGGDVATDTGHDEDAELSAIYNRINRDNGAERGDDGRFAGDGGEGDTGEGGEVSAPAGQSVEAQTVAMPANWRGMEDKWAKIPADIKAELAAHQTGLHTKLSEQGRQISAFQPVNEVLEQNRDLYENKRLPDGRLATPADAVNHLLHAHRRLSADPAQGLIEIADMYGARDDLIAALVAAGSAPQGRQPVSRPQQPSAGISPADVSRVVEEKLSEISMNQELSRLASAKPLYAEIPEEDMVHSIVKARAKLGETATKEAVFDLAYDMAVNADPDLRKKAAAASQTLAAKPVDQKRTADAKRANAINLTSTSTGSSRQLTEDEELSLIYRKSKE